MAQKLNLRLTHPPVQSDIYFGLDSLVSVCHQLSRRGVILADKAVAETHGAQIQKLLGYELFLISSEKTREAKQALEDRLLTRKFGRDVIFVAIGGGNVTDLVGFLASTYMRGVPLILIPTTLLAMVDAAIGGKTGVDTPFGKNLIGSFYLPKAVFIDFEFLKTLPEKEMKNGLSEILKYGLAIDSSIWKKCANWRAEIASLIRDSITCKIGVVEGDFEEKGGLRRILNFGHTVGHALELLSGYQMPHGEAVALGCMAESYLSHLLGHLHERELKNILALYQKLGYAFKKMDLSPFLEALSMDKKSEQGEVRFVLIDQIGHSLPFGGEYCTPVSKKEILQMIQWMSKHASDR